MNAGAIKTSFYRSISAFNNAACRPTTGGSFDLITYQVNHNDFSGTELFNYLPRNITTLRPYALIASTEGCFHQPKSSVEKNLYSFCEADERDGRPKTTGPAVAVGPSPPLAQATVARPPVALTRSPAAQLGLLQPSLIFFCPCSWVDDAACRANSECCGS